ncbi:MAG TPA: glycosyltransferase family 25 protein [Alphaproteobacteria bacterium]|nr:glycosyltransferase family 25 protein [Alphaproteobacteria bacterium]
MSYAGFYINLDRSTDRRAEIESELARHNLAQNYARFAGIDGNPQNLPSPLNQGEIGCFLSHYGVLKQNRGGAHHLHIVEDDALFAAGTAPAILRLIESGEIDNHDLLFLDAGLPLENETYRAFKALYDQTVERDAQGILRRAAFQILGMDKIRHATASSLLVNRHSIDKICRLIEEELARRPGCPIDSFLAEAAREGALKAGCVFPFLTSVRTGHIMSSLVRGRSDTTRAFTAANIARYSFFIGCDWRECRDLAEHLLPLPADPHAALLAHVLAFSLIEPAAERKDANVA